MRRSNSAPNTRRPGNVKPRPQALSEYLVFEPAFTHASVAPACNSPSLRPTPPSSPKGFARSPGHEWTPKCGFSLGASPLSASMASSRSSPPSGRPPALPFSPGELARIRARAAQKSSPASSARSQSVVSEPCTPTTVVPILSNRGSLGELRKAISEHVGIAAAESSNIVDGLLQVCLEGCDDVLLILVEAEAEERLKKMDRRTFDGDSLTNLMRQFVGDKAFHENYLREFQRILQALCTGSRERFIWDENSLIELGRLLKIDKADSLFGLLGKQRSSTPGGALIFDACGQILYGSVKLFPRQNEWNFRPVDGDASEVYYKALDVAMSLGSVGIAGVVFKRCPSSAFYVFLSDQSKPSAYFIPSSQSSTRCSILTSFRKVDLSWDGEGAEPRPTLESSSFEAPGALEVADAVVERAAQICIEWNRNENCYTGAFIVLGVDNGPRNLSGNCIPYRYLRADEHKALKERSISIMSDAHRDTFNKDIFPFDGAHVVDPATGAVSAFFVKLYPMASCLYKHVGKGTKHNTALEMTWDWPCICIVRSEGGGVTVYSQPMTHNGYCLCRDTD